jgi:hypothetical protein
MPDRRQLLQQLGGAAAGALFSSALTRFAAAVESSGPRIKIGQIGVGHAHASKLEVYRASDDYEVVGIVEPNPKLRAEAERDETFRGLPWLTRDELLGTPGLQAVLVETEVRNLLDTLKRRLRPASTCTSISRRVLRSRSIGGCSTPRPSSNSWCRWATCIVTTPA